MYRFTILILLTLLIAGCSSGQSPLEPGQGSTGLNYMSVIDLSHAGNTFNAIGLMGAYEVIVNPDDLSADFIAKRTSAIGEGYIVSGISFFTMTPCSNCLKLKGVGLDANQNAVLSFEISHPFPPGNPSQPPTAANRLDLDVFDLAAVLVPQDLSPTSYALIGSSTYAGLFVEADGYTRELQNVIGDNSALPYYLVIDDSESGTSTYNKFAMGASANFNVKISLEGSLKFDMYLTMGYGASARKLQRLTPKYFNPEFNRNAAWKISVIPPGPAEMGSTWNDSNNTTEFDVEIHVWDWQQGATVYGDPADFENAPTDNIFAASDVSSVAVEIPGMTSSLKSSNTPVSGSGTPSDPLIYTIPIANENSLGEGEYFGLVKITDQRTAGVWDVDGRDFIIDTPDGIILNNYNIPEYATYQIFKADVVVGNLMPVAIAEATTSTNILQGMGVTFDATASYDPDGTIVEYQWDFNEDGIFDGVGDEYTGNPWNPTHSFASFTGDVDVQLKVVDNLNGTGLLESPITITVQPSKNVVLRSGIGIYDIAAIENTDEVLVLFQDHQVWKYSNGLGGGSLLYTMPSGGSSTNGRIEANSNGDSLCGWWSGSSRNTYSYFYNGNLSVSHNYTSLLPTNGEVVALQAAPYAHFQADLSGWFTANQYVWVNRYSPNDSPPYRNASGNIFTPGSGPNNIDLNYVKGAHASYTSNVIWWLEGAPEWRVERTTASAGFLGGFWGGTQTDADTGFYNPQDIASDTSDNVYVLDILSTNEPKIKKFTSSGGSSLGSFGDSESISSAVDGKMRLDASFASGWLYVSHNDMVSVFFPSEQ